jgi:hypothetical protein
VILPTLAVGAEKPVDSRLLTQSEQRASFHGAFDGAAAHALPAYTCIPFVQVLY